MVVSLRVSLSVVSQAVWQVREMSLLAVEYGRGRGVMFTSVRAILAAESAISFPLMFVCEGTHCRTISQPCVVRCRRVCWMVWTMLVEVGGCRERMRCSDERESVYMTALGCCLRVVWSRVRA